MPSLGPLVGSLRRRGGWVSDKLAARVTLFTFVGMIAAVLGVMMFMPVNGQAATSTASWPCSCRRADRRQRLDLPMIPVIFLRERTQAAEGGEAGRKQALAEAAKESAAVLGFSGAIGAYGGFFIRAASAPR